MRQASSEGVRPLRRTGAAVLVVDDDEVNRVLARALLEHLGWEVIECADGREALGILGSTPVSSVLLDISLPDISGLDLCGELRARALEPGLRVVAYTAMAMTSERPRLFAAGFDDILLKPVNLAMMHAAFDTRPTMPD